MQLSLMLLEQIIIMMLMALSGFVVAKRKILSGEDSRSISRLCINIVAPCTLLDGFLTEFQTEKLMWLGIVLALTALIFGLYLLLGTMLRKLGKSPLTPGEQCSITYANSGNLIMPLVQNTLGPGYLIYTCAYQFIQNSLMWTHARSLMSGEKNFALRSGLLSANMCAMYVGLTMFLLRLQLPSLLGGAVKTLGSMLGPLSMLLLGISLSEMDLKAALSSLRVYRVVALRLILFPLLTLAILVPVLRLSPSGEAANVLTVVLLCSSGPSATMMVQLAQLYECPERKEVALINATSTILCAVTIPLMSALFLLLR